MDEATRTSEMDRRAGAMLDRVIDAGWAETLDITGDTLRPSCKSCGAEKMFLVLGEAMPDVAFWWCGECGTILYVTGPEANWRAQDAGVEPPAHCWICSPASAPKQVSGSIALK